MYWWDYRYCIYLEFIISWNSILSTIYYDSWCEDSSSKSLISRGCKYVNPIPDGIFWSQKNSIFMLILAHSWIHSKYWSSSYDYKIQFIGHLLVIRLPWPVQEPKLSNLLHWTLSLTSVISIIGQQDNSIHHCSNTFSISNILFYDYRKSVNNGPKALMLKYFTFISQW